MQKKNIQRCSAVREEQDIKKDPQPGHQKGSGKCFSSKDFPPMSLEGGKEDFPLPTEGMKTQFCLEESDAVVKDCSSPPLCSHSCRKLQHLRPPTAKYQSAASSKTLHMMPFCVARSPVSYFPARKQKFPFWTNFSLPEVYNETLSGCGVKSAFA